MTMTAMGEEARIREAAPRGSCLVRAAASEATAPALGAFHPQSRQFALVSALRVEC